MTGGGYTRFVTFILLCSACDNFQAPQVEDFWLAELIGSHQLLTMAFQQDGNHLSGSASLAQLTVPGAEALTLAGTQHADTLDLSFARSGIPAFRFVGWYVNNRAQISGTLTGAEFTNVGVIFRKP